MFVCQVLGLNSLPVPLVILVSIFCLVTHILLSFSLALSLSLAFLSLLLANCNRFAEGRFALGASLDITNYRNLPFQSIERDGSLLFLPLPFSSHTLAWWSGSRVTGIWPVSRSPKRPIHACPISLSNTTSRHSLSLSLLAKS
jgi:hypothetical protein